MHGRARDDSAVYLPLMTTYFRFDRNPASLYLWAAHVRLCGPKTSFKPRSMQAFVHGTRANW